jgi:8-oxo-dGTP pyrophosphatase MutT (NUDIX family)
MARYAGIFLVRDDGAILLARRSQHVSEPGWWSIPGGAARLGERPIAAALREFGEEMGSVPPLQLVSAHPVRIPKGVFTTVLATIPTNVGTNWQPRLNWEHDNWGWFHVGQLPRPLHPGVSLFVRGEN